jgi:hypothetical protein
MGFFSGLFPNFILEFNMTAHNHIEKEVKPVKGRVTCIGMWMAAGHIGDRALYSEGQSKFYFVPYYYEREFGIYHGYVGRSDKKDAPLVYITVPASPRIWRLAKDVKLPKLPPSHPIANKLRVVWLNIINDRSVGPSPNQQSDFFPFNKSRLTLVPTIS